MSHSYRKAALGGTFDRFHVGHQQLLTTALSQADRIVVGVTQQEMILQKQLASLIEPFAVRRDAVDTWLSNHVSRDRYEIVPLIDPYGPTLFDSSIEALVVSTQTKSGAALVNQKRASLGFSALPVIEAAMVLDEDKEYVSSTRIREGLITRSGRVYRKLFERNITFTPLQLKKLAELQGSLLTEAELQQDFLDRFSAIALVGDVVTETFVRLSLPFAYALIDGKTKRAAVGMPMEAAVYIDGTNNPGTIDVRVAQAIFKAANTGSSSMIIKIDGEEDLLGFIPVLSLPLYSAVFYGQPNRGIGMISVTEATKLYYAKMIDSTFD